MNHYIVKTYTLESAIYIYGQVWQPVSEEESEEFEDLQSALECYNNTDLAEIFKNEKAASSLLHMKYKGYAKELQTWELDENGEYDCYANTLEYESYTYNDYCSEHKD